MLGDRHAGRRHHKGDGGGDIEGAEPVTAGAAQIDRQSVALLSLSSAPASPSTAPTNSEVAGLRAESATRKRFDLLLIWHGR